MDEEERGEKNENKAGGDGIKEKSSFPAKNQKKKQKKKNKKKKQGSGTVETAGGGGRQIEDLHDAPEATSAASGIESTGGSVAAAGGNKTGQDSRPNTKNTPKGLQAGFVRVNGIKLPRHKAIEEMRHMTSTEVSDDVKARQREEILQRTVQNGSVREELMAWKSRFQEGSIRTPLDASDYNLVLNSMNKRLEAHKADLARKFSFANAKLASAQRSGNQKRMMQFQNQIERLQELGSTYNEHTELWNRHHHEFRESREFKELYKVFEENYEIVEGPDGESIVINKQAMAADEEITFDNVLEQVKNGVDTPNEKFGSWTNSLSDLVPGSGSGICSDVADTHCQT